MSYIFRPPQGFQNRDFCKRQMGYQTQICQHAPAVFSFRFFPNVCGTKNADHVSQALCNFFVPRAPWWSLRTGSWSKLVMSGKARSPTKKIWVPWPSTACKNHGFETPAVVAKNSCCVRKLFFHHKNCKIPLPYPHLKHIQRWARSHNWARR